VILTGGAARSTLWPQILADVLGSPVSVPDHVESAALGAAVLAGRAAGVLPPGVAAEDPPGAGRESPGSGRVAYPSPAGQQAYDLLYERWTATCRIPGEGPGRQDVMTLDGTRLAWHRGPMNIEVAVPDDWTVGQTFAVQQLLQHAVREAQPVIALVRKDITPEQLRAIYGRIEEMIREAGLEVQPAPASSS
jgi:hypothetical protein